MKSTYGKYSEFHRLKKNHKSILVNILVSYGAATGRKYLNNSNNNTVSHGGYPTDLDQT